MLELQNIKPEPISKDDTGWFKPLFFECFGKEDLWLEHLEDTLMLNKNNKSSGYRGQAVVRRYDQPTDVPRLDRGVHDLKHAKYKAFHINKQAFIFTYTIDDQTDILTIGVAKNARNQGLALALIQWVITNSSDNQKFFLEVECTNTAAINLYKKIGFQQSSVRKDYYKKYDGSTIDALVMTYFKRNYSTTI